MLRLTGARPMLTPSILVALVATLTCLWTSATAVDSSAAIAAAGISAAEALTAAADSQPPATAYQGPATTLDDLKKLMNVTATAGPTDPESMARDRLKQAQELKTYLETRFANRPEALARIKKAWDQEQRDAFRGSKWQAASSSSIPPGTGTCIRITLKPAQFSSTAAQTRLF